VIALLSDFGYKDAYAGLLHAVILELNPKTTIIDLTHGIAPQNIMSASYVLYTALDHLPPESIIVAVVDPGVGGERDILIARYQDKWIIAPDNGIFSLLENMNPEISFYRPDYKTLYQEGLLPEPSHTFHGRDIFAPLAALLSLKHPALPGPQVSPDSQLLHTGILPLSEHEGYRGYILHFDHFGNAITSIHKDHIKFDPEKNQLRILVAHLIIQGLEASYSSVPADTELAYWGSSGFLEIAVAMGNAEDDLNLEQGQSVEIHFHSS
jgi:S-adenosylmethionine hydrolase